MEGSITGGERRRYLWVLIDLPIQYREMDESPHILITCRGQNHHYGHPLEKP